MKKEDTRHGGSGRKSNACTIVGFKKKTTANKEKMEQVLIVEIMLKTILRQRLKDSVLRSRELYES